MSEKALENKRQEEALAEYEVHAEVHAEVPHMRVLGAWFRTSARRSASAIPRSHDAPMPWQCGQNK